MALKPSHRSGDFTRVRLRICLPRNDAGEPGEVLEEWFVPFNKTFEHFTPTQDKAIAKALWKRGFQHLSHARMIRLASPPSMKRWPLVATVTLMDERGVRRGGEMLFPAKRDRFAPPRPTAGAHDAERAEARTNKGTSEEDVASNVAHSHVDDSASLAVALGHAQASDGNVETMDHTTIEARLADLRREFESGQNLLRELEVKRAKLHDAMLRVGGAMQVLEELIAAEADLAVPS